MKCIIQRVINSSVIIDGKEKRETGKGLNILVGFTEGDTEKHAKKLADKIINLRIFTDENDKLNLSIKDISGEMLVVSNFTLYADSKKGNRPSFINAMHPDKAIKLYENFVALLHESELVVKTGEFGASMEVSIINDGPITIILDSDEMSIK